MPEGDSYTPSREAAPRPVPLTDALSPSEPVPGDGAADARHVAELLREVEAANTALQQTAATLETQAMELEQQTEEAQALAEELELSNRLLQERTADAEAARDDAQASERRAVAVLERVADVFVAYDTDLRCRYLNPPAVALCRSLGAEPPGLAGAVLWDAVPALRGTAFETETLRATRTGVPGEGEAFIEAANRWFRVRVYPAADGVSSYAEDITAKKRAEQERRFLESIDAVLAAALLDYDATLDAVVRHTVPTLADYASIDVLTEAGEVRRVVSAHRDPAKEPLVRELWQRYPYAADGQAGAPVVLRTGQPQLNPRFDPAQIEAFARSSDHLARLRALNPRSYLAVPLTFAGRTIGVLSLVMSDSGRQFDDHALELASDLARRVAAAVEGARLYRDAERTREALAIEAGRDAVLARAGDVLASSLDYEQTLATVAQLVVPAIADWCSVYIAEANGAPRRITVAHADPAKLDLARRLQERYPPDPDAQSGVAQVIRTGRPEIHREITDEMLVRGAIDPEHLRLLRELRLAGVLIVPMVARGQTVGALTLVTAESGRVYGDADVALAAELARRAGLAVDNARLFEAAERDRARVERLQTVTPALAAAVTTADVARGLLEHGLPAMGAVAGVVCRLNDDATAIERVWAVGYPDDGLERFRQIALTAPLPPRDIVATRAPVFVESAAEWEQRYLRPGPGMTTAPAAAGLPLMIADRLVGLMVLRFPSPRTFGPDDRALMMGVASQCAQALERARLYEAEREARAVAETALEAKAAFLGTMSHELRTPVNAILGYTELLETGVRGAVGPEQAEDLRRIRRASGHLLGLINDLLNYTKLEAHQVRFELSPAPVAPVLLEAALMIEPQARAKGLVFECAPCADDLTARGDREKMLQVVLNLLSNAVKFTREGGSVRLAAAPGPESPSTTVRISVTDTGRGIDADQIERIFEPFVQVGRKLTSADQGAGLGLAISRELARGMNGNLTVESVHGEGSVFTFTLPRLTA